MTLQNQSTIKPVHLQAALVRVITGLVCSTLSWYLACFLYPNYLFSFYFCCLYVKDFPLRPTDQGLSFNFWNPAWPNSSFTVNNWWPNQREKSIMPWSLNVEWTLLEVRKLQICPYFFVEYSKRLSESLIVLWEQNGATSTSASACPWLLLLLLLLSCFSHVWFCATL